MYFLVLLSALLACVAGVPLSSTKPKQDGRILGGTDTDITSHPYMVMMWYRDGLYSCVGSIVSEKWVVTVGDCFIKKYIEEYVVRSGSTDPNNGGTLHNITRAFVHGNFSYGLKDYDVGLAEVDPPFTFSDTVQPIELNCDPLPAGTEVVVTGWGTTQGGTDNFSNSLNQRSILISTDSECSDTYHTLFSESVICAGDGQQNTGPCYGDTSAPLVYNNKLAGMFITVNVCGNPDYPGLFTKVSAVCDWIKSNAEL